MRSGLLFRASDHISNRFLLCRMLSASARKMHRNGASTSQSINQCLVALNGSQHHSALNQAQVNEPVLNVDVVEPAANISSAAQAGS
jgi:hypothetical protein